MIKYNVKLFYKIGDYQLNPYNITYKLFLIEISSSRHYEPGPFHDPAYIRQNYVIIERECAHDQ